MYRVENLVGRLVEVKLATPLDGEEVQRFVRELRRVIERIPDKYVGVVDLLAAHVFPPEVAESLIALLSGAAPRVERSALLIGDSAIFGLQVERVLRSSNSPNRRAFRDPGELVEWLREVLTFREQARLEHFLQALAARKPSRP